MQMARTSAAIKIKRCRLTLYRGVNTSGIWRCNNFLAMLGDIHIAEPKAMIGFAGKRD